MTVSTPRHSMHSAKTKPAAKSQQTTQIRRGGRGRWVLLIALLLLAVPIFMEIALRLPGLGMTVYQPRRFEPDGRVPFGQFNDGKSSQVIYQPNTSFSSVYDPAGDTRGYLGAEGRVTYRLNMFGFRGPDLPASKGANVYRILFLGDSITFGEGVREEDTFPVQVQKFLAAKMPGKEVQVINGGVQGYGTKEEVESYYIKGIAYAPNAVVVGFYLNDAMDFGETIRQNDAKNRKMELSGPAKFSKIAEWFQRRSRANEQQEELFASIRASFKSPRWEDCKGQLLRLRGEAEHWKFKLVIVIFPVLWELDHYPLEDLHKALHAQFDELGIGWIDLLDTFQGRNAESLWVHPTDQHPNEIADRMAAEKIADYLAK